MGGKENKRNELVVVENHFRDAWLVYSTSQYSTEQQDLFYPHRIYYSVLFICFPNRLLQLHGAFLFRSCGRIPRSEEKKKTSLFERNALNRRGMLVVIDA